MCQVSYFQSRGLYFYRRFFRYAFWIYFYLFYFFSYFYYQILYKGSYRRQFFKNDLAFYYFYCLYFFYFYFYFLCFSNSFFIYFSLFYFYLSSYFFFYYYYFSFCLAQLSLMESNFLFIFYFCQAWLLTKASASAYLLLLRFLPSNSSISIQSYLFFSSCTLLVNLSMILLTFFIFFLNFLSSDCIFQRSLSACTHYSSQNSFSKYCQSKVDYNFPFYSTFSTGQGQGGGSITSSGFGYSTGSAPSSTAGGSSTTSIQGNATFFFGYYLLCILLYYAIFFRNLCLSSWVGAIKTGGGAGLGLALYCFCLITQAESTIFWPEFINWGNPNQVNIIVLFQLQGSSTSMSVLMLGFNIMLTWYWLRNLYIFVYFCKNIIAFSIWSVMCVDNPIICFQLSYHQRNQCSLFFKQMLYDAQNLQKITKTLQDDFPLNDKSFKMHHSQWNLFFPIKNLCSIMDKIQVHREVLNQYNQIMMRKLYQGFATIKNLKTTAVAIPKGLKVTYPHQQNRTHEIQNPLETFISSLAACELATLRGVTGKNPAIKFGNIAFTRIESNYDLSHWAKGGGKDNKINDIFIEAELETNISPAELEKLREQVENLCPVYQVFKGSGVKINSTWKHKALA